MTRIDWVAIVVFVSLPLLSSLGSSLLYVEPDCGIPHYGDVMDTVVTVHRKGSSARCSSSFDQLSCMGFQQYSGGRARWFEVVPMVRSLRLGLRRGALTGRRIHS